MPLVEAHNPPKGIKDRWKVLEKMELTTQYSFAGDYTGMVSFALAPSTAPDRIQ